MNVLMNAIIPIKWELIFVGTETEKLFDAIYGTREGRGEKVLLATILIGKPFMFHFLISIC